MTDRIPKINALIAQHVAEIIARDLDLRPGVFVTISKVATTRDLRTARIHVGVYPNDAAAYALKTLLHERGQIRTALAQRMKTKILPFLLFIHDDTEQRADEIEQIFRTLDTPSS